MHRSLLYQLGASERFDVESFLEEVELAEELGLDGVWCFPASGPEGDFRGSAPAVWVSALASRTRRIRLGWGVAELAPPAHPPLRFAEQAAAIDVASEGRLELALLPGAGVAPDGVSAWDEGARMLVEMWDAATFSWTSDRFSVPPVDVLPKPVQRPHPPLWLAGWAGEHAQAAGQAGLAFLDVSGGTDATLTLHRDLYTEARAGADPVDLVSPGRVAIAVDLEPGDEGAARIEAWEEAGFDEVVVLAAPLEGGHDEARARIRLLADEGGRVH